MSIILDISLHKYKLALNYAIGEYWKGKVSKAYETLKSAEDEYERNGGLEREIQKNIEPWMINWRKVLIETAVREAESSVASTLQLEEQVIQTQITHEKQAQECPPEQIYENVQVISLEECVDSTFEISNVETTDSKIHRRSKHRSLRRQLRRAIREVVALYEDDKIAEAILLLNQISENFTFDIEKYPQLIQLKEDYGEILRAFELFEDKKDWVAEQSGGPVKVFYKRIPGTPTISIMSEGDLDVSVFNMLSLVYESELYNTWVPFCKLSYTIKQVSRCRKIVYNQFSPPFIDDRDLCIYGYGANLLSTHGCILIVARSCDDKDTFMDVSLPTKDRRLVRAQLNVMACMIKPLGPNKIHLKFINNMDPKVKFLPYRMLNLFSRKFAKRLFKMISKKASNFSGSKHEEYTKLPQNVPFYDHIAKTLDEYFKN
jgi:hypothetical protein